MPHFAAYLALGKLQPMGLDIVIIGSSIAPLWTLEPAACITSQLFCLLREPWESYLTSSYLDFLIFKTRDKNITSLIGLY